MRRFDEFLRFCRFPQNTGISKLFGKLSRIDNPIGRERHAFAAAALYRSPSARPILTKYVEHRGEDEDEAL